MNTHRKFLFVFMLSFAFLAFDTASFALTPAPSLTPKVSPTPSRRISPTTIPGATPTVSDDQVTESLKDRLKKAIEEKSGEATQAITSNQRRAVVGTVKDVATNALTVTAKNGGATTLAATSVKTVFVKSGKTIKFEDVAIGDAVIVMGYPGSQDDILDTRRMVVMDKLTSRNEKILLGTASSLKTKTASFTLTVSQPTELGGDQTFTAVVPKKSGLDMTDVKDNDRLIVVALLDPKNSSTLNLQKFKVL